MKNNPVYPFSSSTVWRKPRTRPVGGRDTAPHAQTHSRASHSLPPPAVGMHGRGNATMDRSRHALAGRKTPPYVGLHPTVSTRVQQEQPHPPLRGQRVTDSVCFSHVL